MSMHLKLSALPVNEKKEYFELMAYLYASGSSIAELISSMLKACKSNQAKQKFSRSLDLFQQGNAFSYALFEAGIVNEQEQAILSGAETTGNMDKAFTMIIDHLRWSEDVKFKLDKALRFSSILLILIILVCSVITNILLPKLIYFAQSGEVVMPLVTNTFLIFAVFIQKYGLYIVGVPFLIWIIGVSLYQISRPFRLFHDYMLSLLPLIGRVSRLSNQVRFLRLLGNLLDQGLGQYDALTIAANSMQNSYFKYKLRKCANELDKGLTLSEVLSQTDFLAPIVLYQMRIAEERGQLASVALKSAETTDGLLQKTIERGASQTEPALAGIIMLIVFWVVIAVIAPIYDAVIMIN